jgi:hypothetical protein
VGMQLRGDMYNLQTAADALERKVPSTGSFSIFLTLVRGLVEALIMCDGLEPPPWRISYGKYALDGGTCSPIIIIIIN